MSDSRVYVDTIAADSFTMDYCRFGSGGKTFVILPGLSIQSVMASAEAVAEAYKPLTDEYTVYVFERRNELPASYTVYDMAEDTAAAFKAAGLEHICLFGASYGGMAAMVIAIRHPELIDKMVLASTSAVLTDHRIFERWMELAKKGDAEKLCLDFGESIYPEGMLEQIRGLLTDAAKTVTEEELSRFITLAEGMKDFDVRDGLTGIRCPVLVVGDKQDRVLGDDSSEKLAQYLDKDPYAELYMYDGCGHALYDTAPDFKERLLDFLRK